jgi:vacuolar protein sorting-associated protein 45
MFCSIFITLPHCHCPHCLDALSQSDILKKSVYLVEKLGETTGHERMVHLNAAIFVRPTAKNIQMLCNEISQPRYGEYHIFFSNILSQDLMQALADADVNEVVKQVHEFYGDYSAVNSELFTLNMPKSLKPDFDSSSLKRTTDGIVSVLLALKKNPEIRFDAASPLAKQLGESVAKVIASDKNGHFHSRKFVPATLLVLDRREDPITPLLTQWTYQAMVHEQIGLLDNRANLKKAGAKDIKKKELEEVVMSVTQDSFFAQHTDSNFGDIAMAIKELVNTFQSQSKSNENIHTLEDMQKFMENYPAFRAQSHQVCGRTLASTTFPPETEL